MGRKVEAKGGRVIRAHTHVIAVIIMGGLILLQVFVCLVLLPPYRFCANCRKPDEANRQPVQIAIDTGICLQGLMGLVHAFPQGWP